MITSPNNPKLRYLRHLSRRAFREREGRMPLEGLRLVEEAMAAGFVPAFALFTEDLGERPRGLALRTALEAAGVPLLEVAPGMLRELAETAQPQGLLAVVEIPELPLPPLPDRVLILDGMRDPGNLGAVLRSADAAGVDAVFLTPGTVEWSNPKVLRSAMGAHFHLPVRRMGWPEIDAFRAGLAPPPSIWLAEADGEFSHSAVDWRQPAWLLIGGEAEGASPEARSRVDGRVRIPMPGRAESLNAAAAAAVLLFEALRQREEG